MGEYSTSEIVREITKTTVQQPKSSGGIEQIIDILQAKGVNIENLLMQIVGKVITPQQPQQATNTTMRGEQINDPYKNKKHKGQLTVEAVKGELRRLLTMLEMSPYANKKLGDVVEELKENEGLFNTVAVEMHKSLSKLI